jgi:pSer/pThr/pTyr-binding forkhead associated (FHA) protein
MFELTAEAIILILRLALVGLLYLFLGIVALTAARELRRLSRGGAAGQRDAVRGQVLVVDPGATSLTIGTVVPLRAVTRLGRSPSSTILLDGTYVSAEHAVIALRDGSWWLSDSGSTNGTALNGVTIRGDTALSDGDIVEIGDVKLRVTV